MKWALVTGASQGIGAAICRELSRQGWSLILVSRNQDKLKRVASTLLTENMCIAADVTQEASLNALITQVESKLGSQGLKALVNNAGSFERLRFDETTRDLWQAQFDIHVTAPAFLCKGLKSTLLKSSLPSVLNISSTLGVKPVPQTSAYSAMKAAMNSLTQSLALEWSPQIRVNGICPGIVDTPLHAFHEDKEEYPRRQGVHSAHPLGRMGKPEDIALTAAFLLSDASAWTTGALWNVDGGISLL